MTTPSPQTWTLRLKARKTTVLLHVDPLNTFAAIKSYLYDALKDTDVKDPDTGATIPLPASPSDIQLGRPVDMHDPQQGFRVGEWEHATSEEQEDAPTAKGKGKARAGANKANGAATAGAANAEDCPKGAGLKDGAVLAFRWRGDGTWDGDDEGHDVDMEHDGENAAGLWGIQLASFEDAYGVENSTDVGGGREFEG